MRIQQILLMTDFSDHARSAYCCAANLATKFHAQLHLVHYASAIQGLLGSTARASYFDKLDKALADEANSHMVFEGIEVQHHLQRHRWTRSRQRSLEQELKADLLVMSPQGPTKLRTLFSRNFANRVVESSTVHVLLFRPTKGFKAFDPQTVMVPHDLYERPRSILPTMRWLDSHYHTTFRFLYVYDPSWVNSRSFWGLEEKFALALSGTPLDSVEGRFAKLAANELWGLDAMLETAQGFPAQQVVNRAHNMQADLILLENHGGLDSVTRTVARNAECSVLIVPAIHAEKWEQIDDRLITASRIRSGVW